MRRVSPFSKSTEKKLCAYALLAGARETESHRVAHWLGKISCGASSVGAFTPLYTRERPRTMRRKGSTPFESAKKISPTRRLR